jgi:hypothetical protein
MNKLKPFLPSNKEEVVEFGFQGNIAEPGKYITDGRSMILISSVPDGMEFDAPEEPYGKPVPEQKIQDVWDKIENRASVSADFIGCATLDSLKVVAVVRDKKGRIVIFDPYILKFALMNCQADGLSLADAHNKGIEAMALLCAGEMVGSIMAMRYDRSDVKDYDLDGPAVELTQE